VEWIRMAGGDGGHPARTRVGACDCVAPPASRKCAGRHGDPRESVRPRRQGCRDRTADPGPVMSRLQAAFARLRQNGSRGLVTYVTAGDPDLSQSREVIRALARGGADVIEVGVPFSDPIADGPAIQRASERALAAGADLAASLQLIEQIRAEVPVPLVLFTYVNPVLRMGVDNFVSRSATAGVDGVLLLDLPIEESVAVQRALEGHGVD